MNSLFTDLGGNVGLVSQYISDKYNCNILILNHIQDVLIISKKF